MLDTTHKDATIEEKNDVPTIEKEHDKATATIGETVNYTVTIEAKPGAENYVMHDTMTDGLTFNNDVVIEGLTEGTDYTVVTTGLTDGCTFEVVFTSTYLKSITANTTLTVTYSAILNEDAVIAGDNTNTVDLTYGDNNRTEESQVTTQTYEFELVKTDAANKVITGATFELSKTDDGEAIEFVEVTGGYRVATAEEIADVDVTTTTTIAAGYVKIIGLGNGTYYLTQYSAANPFSSRIVCGECGGIYGSKIWHSSDKYRRVVWVCNRRYRVHEREGSGCSTPHLSEEEIKSALDFKSPNEVFAEYRKATAGED